MLPIATAMNSLFTGNAIAAQHMAQLRVMCLSPNTPSVEATWRRYAENTDVSEEAWRAQIAQKTLLRRLPMLAEAANAAVLMAFVCECTSRGDCQCDLWRIGRLDGSHRHV